jgi:hypothetical protein
MTTTEQKNQAAIFPTHSMCLKKPSFYLMCLRKKCKTELSPKAQNLFGTIIPSSNGQALVNTPQNGKIISLNVQM